MLRLKTFPESHIPTEEIQHLRNLVKLRQRFVKESTKLRNQIHALLDKDGIKFPVKTPFTQKWCAHLHKYLTETNSVELRYLYESEQENQKRINNISMDLVTAAKKQFPKEIDLLKSIPGVGDIFSSYLVAQIMPISRFLNKKKLRRYAGVIPVTDSSALQTYGTYLPKSSSRTILRYALVEAAHGAVKVEGKLKQYYKKKLKGNKKAQALMAVASSLSDIVWNVLHSGKPYLN
jgi:transposase